MKKHICEKVLFIDKNPYATYNTLSNLYKNNLGGRGFVLLSDIADIEMKKTFDLIIANPPYLPREYRWERDYSTIGGDEGYETVSRFIDLAAKVLRRNGLFYLVYSSLSKPYFIEKYLNREEFVIKNKWSKHFFFEDIYVVEVVKK